MSGSPGPANRTGSDQASTGCDRDTFFRGPHFAVQRTAGRLPSDGHSECLGHRSRQSSGLRLQHSGVVAEGRISRHRFPDILATERPVERIRSDSLNDLPLLIFASPKVSSPVPDSTSPALPATTSSKNLPFADSSGPM